MHFTQSRSETKIERRKAKLRGHPSELFLAPKACLSYNAFTGPDCFGVAQRLPE